MMYFIKIGNEKKSRFGGTWVIKDNLNMQYVLEKSSNTQMSWKRLSDRFMSLEEPNY